MLDYKNIKVTVSIPFRWYIRANDGYRGKKQVDGKMSKHEPGMLYYDNAEMNGLSQVVTLSQVVDQIRTNEITRRRCDFIRNPNVPEKDAKHVKIIGLNRLYWGEFNLTNGKFEDADIKYHPGIMCFDVDKLDSSRAYFVKQILSEDPYVICAFISPRSVGVKFLVAAPANLLEHSFRYEGIKQYYEKLLDVKLDPSCKNIARTCFLSHDPNPYVNWEAEMCMEYDTTELMKSITPNINVIEKSKIYGEETMDHKFECAKKRVEEKGHRWIDGSKHAYLTSLAGTCKGFDMDEHSFRNLGHEYIIDSLADKTVKSIFN